LTEEKFLNKKTEDLAKEWDKEQPQSVKFTLILMPKKQKNLIFLFKNRGKLNTQMRSTRSIPSMSN